MSLRAPRIEEKTYKLAIWAHVLPFGAWIALMHFLDLPHVPASWAYAIRSTVCLGLLFYFRPWRWYAPPAWRYFPIGALLGAGVFVIWVAPEHPAAARLGPLQDWFVTWAVLPLGERRAPITAFPYAPEVCGWPLTIVRILGSGLAIGVIEEFFWRGFLYRWMFGGDFRLIDPGRFARAPFFAIAVVFALEHREWLAGLIAGIAYGWLFIKTRDIWSVAFAHALTNLLLGAYVVATGQYQFWS